MRRSVTSLAIAGLAIAGLAVTGLGVTGLAALLPALPVGAGSNGGSAAPEPQPPLEASALSPAAAISAPASPSPSPASASPASASLASASPTAASLAGSPAAGPPAASGVPEHPALRGLRVEERPGQALPLEAELVDHRGRPVRLGRYFDGLHPVLLVLGYYRCPMLCSLVLRATTSGLEAADLVPGEFRQGIDGPQGFRVVVVSIDPAEGPEEAALQRRTLLGEGGRSPFAAVADDAWPFLVGEEEAVAAIAGAAGFHYRWDAASGTYAHPAAIFAVAPDGRVARTLHGVRFPPEDLRRALAAAAAGDAGRSVHQVLVQCFRYTPALRRWAGAVTGFLRAGGVLILLGLGGVFWLSWRRRRRPRREGTVERQPARRPATDREATGRNA